MIPRLLAGRTGQLLNLSQISNDAGRSRRHSPATCCFRAGWGSGGQADSLMGAPLLIVEVQSGSALGEDDIERFEDKYNHS